MRIGTLKTCNGKYTYPSEKAAKDARNKREREVSKLRIYECDICHGYHLTKQHYHDLKTGGAKWD